MNKWLVMLFFLVGFILIGCASSSSGDDLSGEKPPEAKIEIGDNLYETVLGTYCWKTGNKGECVDTVGSKELLKDKEPIKVSPGEKVTFVMDYEPRPNEFHVLQISETEEIEIMVDNNSFSAPDQPGIYYYSYGVWWMDEKSENVSNGDAFYNFALEVE